MSSERPLYIAPAAPVLPYAGGPSGTTDANAWVEGDILIVRNGAALPPRCVKCNAPVTASLLTRKYMWHPPGYYFLILLHIIIYAIVATIVRKSGTVRVGLCEAHRIRRRNNILIGTSIGVGGLLLFAAGLAIAVSTNGNTPLVALMAIGPLFAIVGLIWGIVGARVLRPKKIDGHFLWLSGASLDFLHGEGIANAPLPQAMAPPFPPRPI